MIEIKEKRQRFGNDKNAINRHSVRIYEYSTSDHTRFCLDKTLDAFKPFYTLSCLGETKKGKVFPEQYWTIPTTIKVGGMEHWGEGLSWKQAEAKASEAIELLAGNW